MTIAMTMTVREVRRPKGKRAYAGKAHKHQDDHATCYGCYRSWCESCPTSCVPPPGPLCPFCHASGDAVEVVAPGDRVIQLSTKKRSNA